MFRLRDFLTRHRRKFVITGVVVGGTYLAIKYVQHKFIDMQEKSAKEFIEKTRKIKHFESTEATCNQVIISIATDLVQVIIKQCNTDELVAQLRENPPNKLELWDEMKIVAFTRLTAFIYASSMLAVALRIQLNLMGGYLYHEITTTETKQSNIQTNQQKISDDLKQQYLSLIRHFVYDGGLSELVRLIRSKVISVTKQLPLTKPLSFSDMEQLFWSLQISINSDPSTDPCSKISKYLLPGQLPYYSQGDALLEKMFNETLDILESDDAISVCSNNISRGFSLAVDYVVEGMGDNITLDQKLTGGDGDKCSSVNDSTNNSNNNSSTSASSPDASEDIPNINSMQYPLAKFLPIVSGLTSEGYDTGSCPQNFATSLITFYLVSEKCKVLGANVYETFSLP